MTTWNGPSLTVVSFVDEVNDAEDREEKRISSPALALVTTPGHTA